MSARPCVTPLSKDFRFVLSREGGSSGGEELVTAGGLVEAKWAVEGETWKCLRRNILVSQDSGDGVVIVQRTQNCIYNEWKGFSWWTLDLQAFLSDPCRNKNPHLQEQ
ncbi:uncharacterized protein LOC120286269 isoform X1 [Eucalyptus grandis]|uniref:uncharacterized protein LOC120286269 isoform X1 n=1 Tax=Eucalyptus grandis TaxID=71139 RepID=UPI00192EF325|nr:uncharacterized protein LOC120286269 isoform X1 [Eucalyptus grandis]